MNGTGNLTSISAKSVPRFELIDKDGHRTGYRPHDVTHLASIAKFYFPDQTQDPERLGRGWDIAVVGGGR